MENHRKKSPQDAHTAASRGAGGTLYPRISSKSSRKRVAPVKEIREQSRIRSGFEKKLNAQLRKSFQRTGRMAREEYEKVGRLVNTPRQSQADISKILINHYRAVIDEFGLRMVRDYKQESQFEMIIRDYINRVGGDRIVRITNSTLQRIRRIIVDGEREGVGVAKIGRNIFERMDGSFSKRRAATIARTETHNAASFANHQVNASFGIPNQKKRWVSVADPRTRGHHASMNGVEVDIDEDFIVNGRPMGYAGDPRGGAGNVINCRCVILYVTPDDEVFVDETTPVAQKPIKEPLKERNRGGRIEPTDLALIKVFKRNEVEKQLTEQLSEANDDPRYLNRSVTHYRGAKKEMYGKATLGKKISDEGASVILALKREMDDIMDAVDLPRIRSIQVKPSKRHNMAMGDGILYINPEYVDNLVLGSSLKARQVKPEDRDKRFFELVDEQERLTIEYNGNKERMTDIITEKSSLNRDDFDSMSDYFAASNALNDEYKKLGNKNKRLFSRINQVRVEKDAFLEGSQQLPVSTWTPNDPIKDRPFSSKNYLEDPLDRIRHTVYHEIGHQIHQTYKMKLKKEFVGSPRQEQGLEPFWTQVDRPLDKWLERTQTKNILYGGGSKGNVGNPEVAKLTWSTYGNYNGHEWFAENNANYWRGDLEKTDPRFVTMMDNILNGRDIDDTSISVSE